MTTPWPISRSPLPHDPKLGAAVRALVPDLRADGAALVLGTAGSSPYLAGLIEADPAWVASALAQDPDLVMSGLLDEARALPPDNLQSGLRALKRKVALLTALADLSGVWTLESVTGALSDFADLAVDRAIRALVAREARRGKLPGVDEEAALKDVGGLAVIAMGKMGARELNYSSDIDLICLFDESLYDHDDYMDARTALVRATRSMAQMLSELTGDGYVFRTDLRLRPDPAVTPVCLSMEAAERYYESLGRTWERAAYVKARAAAGNIDAGESFLKRLTPFVWRKHLDFAAIEDAHDMRLRIREHKGLGGPLVLRSHDMKLGRGGIREIEFFTQTRQIIAGGRDPSLRDRGTVPALAALAKGGWVAPEVAKVLTEDYIAHREVEHRLQMIGDAQTHALPNSDDGFGRLAHLMGSDDPGALCGQIRSRLERVHQLTEPFFAPGTGTAKPIETHGDAVARWMRLPALRSERARARFKRLRPMILERLDAAAQPAEALTAFENFLSGLPAGVQLFALFEANPQLIDLIVDIAGTAPALAEYLGRNSAVLDAVIGGTFFDAWPGAEVLGAELEAALAAAPDYEAGLDAARRWMKEWHFRIGVHHLRGIVDGAQAGTHYAELAGAVLAGLWPFVAAEFAVKHGKMPGLGAAVLGMGSLGSGRLNAGSDLDLIVIYDPGTDEVSAGRRPLPSGTYYARLTQAMVTALSAPMAQGRLYEVDMRLRPSGRKGPVATAFSAFCNYQQNEAWGWEHLALTRARPVAGTLAICTAVDKFRTGLLSGLADPAKALADLADMRTRLDAARPRRTPWDVKDGPGAIRDLELFAQAAALASGSPARTTADQLGLAAQLGWVSAEELTGLVRAYDLMWSVVAAERLLIAGDFDAEVIGQGGRDFIVSGTPFDSADALARALGTTYQSVAAIIDRVAAMPEVREET